MKKKWLLWAFALVLVAAIAFFALAPGIVERGMNKVVATKLPTVAPETRKLHAGLQIADLHEDTLLWKRSLNDRADRGQVDLPRLIEGNVALQVFSSVTKTPKNQNYDANGADTDNITLLTVAQLQPPRTWTSLLERSLFHAQKLDRAAAASDGQFRVIRTPRRSRRAARRARQGRQDRRRPALDRGAAEHGGPARQSRPAVRRRFPHGRPHPFLRQ